MLKALQANARVTGQEIASAIGISRVTVHDRIRKLVQNGIITGFHAILNAPKVGYPVTAIIGLRTIQGKEAYRTIEDLKRIHEIEESHITTGQYDFLVKVRARNNEHLQRILLEKIDQIHGFQRAETMIVLSSPIERPGLQAERLEQDIQEYGPLGDLRT